VTISLRGKGAGMELSRQDLYFGARGMSWRDNSITAPFPRNEIVTPRSSLRRSSSLTHHKQLNRLQTAEYLNTKTNH